MRSSIVPATRSVSTSSTATPESAAEAGLAADPQSQMARPATDTARRESGSKRPGKAMAQRVPQTPRAVRRHANVSRGAPSALARAILGSPQQCADRPAYSIAYTAPSVLPMQTAPATASGVATNEPTLNWRSWATTTARPRRAQPRPVSRRQRRRSAKRSVQEMHVAPRPNGNGAGVQAPVKRARCCATRQTRFARSKRPGAGRQSRKRTASAKPRC